MFGFEGFIEPIWDSIFDGDFEVESEGSEGANIEKSHVAGTLEEVSNLIAAAWEAGIVVRIVRWVVIAGVVYAVLEFIRPSKPETAKH